MRVIMLLLVLASGAARAETGLGGGVLYADQHAALDLTLRHAGPGSDAVGFRFEGELIVLAGGPIIIGRFSPGVAARITPPDSAVELSLRGAPEVMLIFLSVDSLVELGFSGGAEIAFGTAATRVRAGADVLYYRGAGIGVAPRPYLEVDAGRGFLRGSAMIVGGEPIWVVELGTFFP
jgi:hypothetical protein